MGRFLQEQYGQEPQVIITLPILEGLDGVQKMSKSLGNAIGLAEPADQAYGKIMSISDDLMWRYYSLLLKVTDADIATMQQEVKADKAHPMALKKELAYKIIERFWSESDARAAQNAFEHLFQKKDFSHAQEVTLPHEQINIIELLVKLNAVESKSEARRLVEANAVTIDEGKIADPKAIVAVKAGMQIKVGKHKFYKVV